MGNLVLICIVDSGTTTVQNKHIMNAKLYYYYYYSMHMHAVPDIMLDTTPINTI